MTEKIASRQDVSQPKLGPQSLQVSLRITSVGSKVIEFDLEVIIRISRESGETVSRNFILVIDFGDWCSDIVRMKLLVCRYVVEDNLLLVDDTSSR